MGTITKLVDTLTFLYWYCDADDPSYIDAIEEEINTHHPNSFIIKIKDGENGYFKNENLVDWVFNGYQKVMDQSMGSWIIQLDPDSKLHRKVNLPVEKKDNLWFGQIINGSNFKSTWGCGVLMHRKLIKLILDNKELFSSTYDQYDTTYLKKGKVFESRDILMGLSLNKIGLFPKDWSVVRENKEIKLNFVKAPSFDSGKWAITHPR